MWGIQIKRREEFLFCNCIRYYTDITKENPGFRGLGVNGTLSFKHKGFGIPEVPPNQEVLW